LRSVLFFEVFECIPGKKRAQTTAIEALKEIPNAHHVHVHSPAKNQKSPPRPPPPPPNVWAVFLLYFQAFLSKWSSKKPLKPKKKKKPCRFFFSMEKFEKHGKFDKISMFSFVFFLAFVVVSLHLHGQFKNTKHIFVENIAENLTKKAPTHLRGAR
jgi:hypothetical protein